MDKHWQVRLQGYYDGRKNKNDGKRKDRNGFGYNYENWHEPHPPVAFSPVLCNEQLVSCVFVQSELGTVPVSAVLFWSEMICNEGEKLIGSGP